VALYNQAGAGARMSDDTPPALVSFDSLPLGARFNYADHPNATFVKLENGGTGLIAEWEHPALDWPGQGIYGFADSEKRTRGWNGHMD
jgi:hypothetical protein